MLNKSAGAREHVSYARTIIGALAQSIPLENKVRIPADALDIFQCSLKRGILHGRSLDELIASSFMFSLRRLGESVSVQELRQRLHVLGLEHISEKALLSTEKVIAQELGESLLHLPKHANYIKKLVSKMQLMEEEKEVLARRSLEILGCVPHRYLMGKKPLTIVAAILYAAVDLSADEGEPLPGRHLLKVTQDEISEVSGVSSVSIRNHYARIEQYAKERGWHPI